MGGAMIDPRNYAASEILKDGTPVTIRAIRPGDSNNILVAFKALDHEGVYRRFFSPKKSLTDNELKQLTEVDFSQVVALVATVPQTDGEEMVIGGGRYAGSRDSQSAELAFLIVENYRGRGIAGLLLKHLMRIAKDAGLSEIEADVLAENQPMLTVFRHSGLPIRERREGSVIHVTLTV
jgi:RimJ/RimL family protein N-acetyltransferase